MVLLTVHNCCTILLKGVDNMASTSITIRMDDSLKKQAEYLLDDMGLNMTTAVTMFMKAVVHQRKIPFEITAEDPFYSEENQRVLRNSIANLEAGKGQVHELIEVDDD
jgi:DNA-damage-inducible protein J